MKKIVICGATGFIGRNLVEKFAHRPEYEIIAISHKRPQYDHPNITWVAADLRNPEDVDRIMTDAEIVIQAAATTSGAKDIATKPYIHVTDNAVMNSLLLRAAYEHAVEHFIFFSCSIMYPSSSSPVKEDAFTGEISSKYFGAGWTKVYTENMCEFYAGLGRTKHTVIRHSNIYGPWDKFDLERSHVFGATVTKAMLAESELKIWGTGEERRDLLHVDDLINFVDLAIQKQSTNYGLYNCGAGTSISVRELVEKIVHATGKKLTLTHDLSQPSIPFDLALDCKKAHDELGWQPSISIDDGIARTVQWWTENIDRKSLKPLS